VRAHYILALNTGRTPQKACFSQYIRNKLPSRGWVVAGAPYVNLFGVIKGMFSYKQLRSDLIMRNIKPKMSVLLFSVLIVLSGCVSVPPEVAQAHQKELEIIEALKVSHLSMVDAYIDQRIMTLEEFYFGTYAPAYLENWKSSFRQLENRDYDEKLDFSILYPDLVVEYQEVIKPVEIMRIELKNSINTEFTNAIQAHQAIDKWIRSVNSLQTKNKVAIDALLGNIKPGLSLDEINQRVSDARSKIQ
jgi:hypothetical protein